jgi:hypothetical protein
MPSKGASRGRSESKSRVHERRTGGPREPTRHRCQSLHRRALSRAALRSSGSRRPRARRPHSASEGRWPDGLAVNDAMRGYGPASRACEGGTPHAGRARSVGAGARHRRDRAGPVRRGANPDAERARPARNAILRRADSAELDQRRSRVPVPGRLGRGEAPDDAVYVVAGRPQAARNAVDGGLGAFRGGARSQRARARPDRRGTPITRSAGSGEFDRGSLAARTGSGGSGEW